MPYIKIDRRVELYWNGSVPENCGELNYLITKTIISYWEEHKNYQGINDIVGALTCAKDEFYRRVAVPYENEKIKTNGDVYE